MITIFKNIISVLSKKEKRKFNLIIILNMLVSAADIFSLVFILFIIKLYTQDNIAQSFSFLPQQLRDHHSVFPLLLFLFFFILKNIAAYLAYHWQYRFVYGVASRISRTGILKYLEGKYDDYVTVDSAVQIRKISQQPIEFAHYVLAGVQQMISEFILVTLAVIAVFFYNAKLFLLLAALLFPAVALLSYFTKTKLKHTRANIKLTNESALQYLKEALSGFTESNIFDRHIFFTNRYASKQKTLNAYLANLHTTQGLPSRFFETLSIFALFILIAVNMLPGNPAPANIITIGAFMAAAYKIIPGITKMINISGQIKTYEYTVHDLLNLKKEKNENIKNAAADEKIESVIFNNISFSYYKNSILKNFDLSIKSADFTGISGNSGKGKTTLVNLLFGFVQPDEGKILINNKNCDAGAKKSFREKISYVKQQPFLIYDSIERNITLEENTNNKQMLDEAVHASGLSELLDEFPEGILKQITENGKNISGGQRQRIAIARALYKKADMIILDEPFNELDYASELLLLQHFRKLSENGKIIFSSHTIKRVYLFVIK